MEVDGVVHVIPEADQRVHEPFDCWCKPLMDPWLNLVHNALDKRDRYEDKWSKPS